MKLLVAAICALLAISAHAEDDWVEIDWSSVIPIEDSPGFWDGRDIKPVINSKDPKRSGRISGGEHVVPHSHPHQACVYPRVGRDTNLCGGSLITDRAVLISANCITGASSTQVILGAHRVTVVEPSQQRQTVQPAGYRIHGLFHRATFANDVAVLVLPQAATFNSFVSAIALPALGETNDYNRQLATIAGWGRMSSGNTGTSQHLRYTQSHIIHNDLCRVSHGTSVHDSSICMSGELGRQACGGDFGGPMTVVSGNARVQVGIVVMASGCDSGRPTVATRVTSFRQWIENVMRF